MALRTWQLFALAVLVWGTTWHAIIHQLAETPAAWGVGLRFALAGALCLGVGMARQEAWRLGPKGLGLAGFQGVFMFSLSYLCVYEAERHVPSGLVAVGYSLSPLVNGVVSHLIWRTPLSRRFVLGASLGVVGVALIFWPELQQLNAQRNAWMGAAFTLGAVLLSSVGSLASSRNKHLGLPFWSTMGWGMLVGSGLTLVWAAVQGPLPWPLSFNWWWSWAYLAVAGSAVAFACYLTLQQRLGPGKASTVGVATPVLALIMSTALEGFQPQGWTLAGVLLALVGNGLALELGRPRQDAA